MSAVRMYVTIMQECTDVCIRLYRLSGVDGGSKETNVLYRTRVRQRLSIRKWASVLQQGKQPTGMVRCHFVQAVRSCWTLHFVIA